MFAKGRGGVARDTVRAVELLRLSGFNEDLLSELGADKGSPEELARLERVRLARYDKARRGGGGRTPAQLVSIALAGGAEWDRLANELAAAAAQCDSDDGAAEEGDGQVQVAPVARPPPRRVEAPAERDDVVVGCFACFRLLAVGATPPPKPR